MNENRAHLDIDEDEERLEKTGYIVERKLNNNNSAWGTVDGERKIGWRRLNLIDDVKIKWYKRTKKMPGTRAAGDNLSAGRRPYYYLEIFIINS